MYAIRSYYAKKTKVQLSKDIFPAEAWELISKNRKSDDLVIIDVSTPQEYKNLHLEGAINVNLRITSYNVCYTKLLRK